MNGKLSANTNAPTSVSDPDNFDKINDGITTLIKIPNIKFSLFFAGFILRLLSFQKIP